LSPHQDEPSGTLPPPAPTVGDAYDNALAESVTGLFKTELIRPRGPWRTAQQVEIATPDYVGWFDHRQLCQACGDNPPAELEAAHYGHNSSLAEAVRGHEKVPMCGQV
jgi:putative transposase